MVNRSARAAAGSIVFHLEYPGPGLAGIVENRDTGKFRNGFFEQLQPLAAQFCGKESNTGDVAAGTGKAFNMGLPRRDRSQRPNITMGIVVVAFLAARIGAAPSSSTMISTLRRASWGNKLGKSDRVSPQHIGTQ